MTKVLMRSMALGKPTHPMSFHHSGKASTFRPTDNVDPVPKLEDLPNPDFTADLVAINVIYPELAEDGEWACARFLTMS